MLRLLAMHSSPRSLLYLTPANRHACLYPASLLILPSNPPLCPACGAPCGCKHACLCALPTRSLLTRCFISTSAQGLGPYSLLSLVQLLQPDCCSSRRRGPSRRRGGSGPSGSGGVPTRTTGPTARLIACKTAIVSQIEVRSRAYPSLQLEQAPLGHDRRLLSPACRPPRSLIAAESDAASRR